MGLSRRKEIIIAIPIFGAIGILVLILNFGYCFLGICETEVEIISINMPEKIFGGQPYQGEFIIKNIGQNSANCVLSWNLNLDKYTIDDSDYFIIEPQQERKIVLEGSFKGRSNAPLCSTSGTSEITTSVRASCKNTMSGLYKETLLLECP